MFNRSTLPQDLGDARLVSFLDIRGVECLVDEEPTPTANTRNARGWSSSPQARICFLSASARPCRRGACRRPRAPPTGAPHHQRLRRIWPMHRRRRSFAALVNSEFTPAAASRKSFQNGPPDVILGATEQAAHFHQVTDRWHIEGPGLGHHRDVGGWKNGPSYPMHAGMPSHWFGSATDEVRVSLLFQVFNLPGYNRAHSDRRSDERAETGPRRRIVGGPFSAPRRCGALDGTVSAYRGSESDAQCSRLQPDVAGVSSSGSRGRGMGRTSARCKAVAANPDAQGMPRAQDRPSVVGRG